MTSQEAQIALPIVISVTALIVWYAWRAVEGPRCIPPAVGQVWRSQHSGRSIEVVKVRTHDNGCIEWSIVQRDRVLLRPGSRDPLPNIPQTYLGLREWRSMIREEKRVLVEVAP